VSEAEAIASAASAAAETVEEAEAAEEGLDHAAEQGMQEERGNAATVAMLAEAKKQAPALTQVSLSPLAASVVVVAEEAPVADVSDAGTKEAATTTAPGIIVTSDKYASANTMQEQHEEAMKEAAARSSDEYSQTGKRGETITIDAAVSATQTSQVNEVIPRSGKRPRSNQVKKTDVERKEQEMCAGEKKRKCLGRLPPINEAECRITREQWVAAYLLNSGTETVDDHIEQLCRSRPIEEIILTHSIPNQKGESATISCRHLKTIVRNELLTSKLVDLSLQYILSIVSGGEIRDHDSIYEIYPNGREPMLIFGFDWFTRFELNSQDENWMMRWMKKMEPLDLLYYNIWYIAVVTDVHFLWADVLFASSQVRFRDSLRQRKNSDRYKRIFQFIMQMLSNAAKLSGKTVDLNEWSYHVCQKTIQQGDLTSCGPLFLRNGFDEISSEKGGMGPCDLCLGIFRKQMAKFLLNEIFKQKRGSEGLELTQEISVIGAHNAETEGNESVYTLEFELTSKKNRETGKLHLFNKAPYGTVFGKAAIRRAQGANQPFSHSVFLRGDLHSVQPHGSCGFICIFEGIDAANQDPVLRQKLLDIFGPSCKGWTDLCSCVQEIKKLHESEILSGQRSASYDLSICKRLRLLFSQQMSNSPDLFIRSFSDPCHKRHTQRSLPFELKKAGIQVNEDVVANVNYANVLNWALAFFLPILCLTKA
jgi:hypothetical protein